MSQSFWGEVYSITDSAQKTNRERKKSVGGTDICFPPAQRTEDQGVETGVSSTLTSDRGPGRITADRLCFFPPVSLFAGGVGK